MPFENASLAWTLQWDADWVTAVAFVGPRRVAAGNNLGQILVWDLPEKPGGDAPLPSRRLDGHTNVISRLIGLGNTLISSSYDHTIRYWGFEPSASASAEAIELNARTREDLKRRSASKIPAPLTAQVKVQPSTRVLEGHKEWIQSMALSADGKALYSADDAGEIIVWDRESAKEKRRWKIARGWCYALAVSPDEKLAFVSERLPLVFDSGRHVGANIWDITAGQVKVPLREAFGKEYLSAAVFSADGKSLLVGRGGEADGMNGKITFLDPATGKKIREASAAHQCGVTDLALHPDGKHFASAGRDTVVRLFQLADGKQVKELGKPRGGQFKDWIHAVAFSPDGKWLAAADMAGAVQVWSL